MYRLILLIIAAVPSLALAVTTQPVATVPEPSTMALIAGGVAAAGLYKRLTRNRDK